MFDLHARIYLDKIEFIVVHIHQKLNGAGAFVIHMLADTSPQITDFGALGIGEIGGRSAFYHFLITPLYGAVALI